MVCLWEKLGGINNQSEDGVFVVGVGPAVTRVKVVLWTRGRVYTPTEDVALVV